MVLRRYNCCIDERVVVEEGEVVVLLHVDYYCCIDRVEVDRNWNLDWSCYYCYYCDNCDHGVDRGRGHDPDLYLYLDPDDDLVVMRKKMMIHVWGQETKVYWNWNWNSMMEHLNIDCIYCQEVEERTKDRPVEQ